MSDLDKPKHDTPDEESEELEEVPTVPLDAPADSDGGEPVPGH